MLAFFALFQLLTIILIYAQGSLKSLSQKAILVALSFAVFTLVALELPILLSFVLFDLYWAFPYLAGLEARSMRRYRSEASLQWLFTLLALMVFSIDSGYLAQAFKPISPILNIRGDYIKYAYIFLLFAKAMVLPVLYYGSSPLRLGGLLTSSHCFVQGRIVLFHSVFLLCEGMLKEGSAIIEGLLALAVINQVLLYFVIKVHSNVRDTFCDWVRVEGSCIAAIGLGLGDFIGYSNLMVISLSSSTVILSLSWCLSLWDEVLPRVQFSDFIGISIGGRARNQVVFFATSLLVWAGVVGSVVLYYGALNWNMAAQLSVGLVLLSSLVIVMRILPIKFG